MEGLQGHLSNRDSSNYHSETVVVLRRGMEGLGGGGTGTTSLESRLCSQDFVLQLWREICSVYLTHLSKSIATL